MADEEQIKLLRRGVRDWNAWRESRMRGLIDLAGANLSRMQFDLFNFSGGDLRDADFADAQLGGADLTWTNCRGANFSGARFGMANLTGAILCDTNFTKASLLETVLADVDLSNATGLETCRHVGPSILDFRTLQKSGPLPLVFLRGAGFPETVIDYLPSLLNQPIQMYSCFISYSSKDDDFAKRLHADLQNNGVRCWFAPHDMPIGAKIWDALDEAIRHRDKLLLILSENSILSDWVEDEVNKAFAEERDRKQTVLFPIRIDDEVLKTSESWATKLRERHIGDFINWTDHDAYQKNLARLLRDLAVKRP